MQQLFACCSSLDFLPLSGCRGSPINDPWPSAVCSPALASLAVWRPDLAWPTRHFSSLALTSKTYCVLPGSSGAERIDVAGQLLSAVSLAGFARSVAQLASRS